MSREFAGRGHALRGSVRAGENQPGQREMSDAELLSITQKYA